MLGLQGRACQAKAVNIHIEQKEGRMVYDELRPRLAGVAVKNLKSDSIELASLWGNRPILMSFLRHFG